MVISKNQARFEKLDLTSYSGKAIGVVDGKVVFENKNPKLVMKWLMEQPKEKETSLICVPSSKAAMVL